MTMLTKRFGATGVRGFAAAAILLALTLSAPSAGAETLTFHASQSGMQTLDQGEGGGNPFASALIDVLGRKSMRLAELAPAIGQLTAAKSRNFQQADVPEKTSNGTWDLVPAKSGETRIALVMVVSNYAASGGAGTDPAPSLDGARRDAMRVAKALEAAGFKTQLVLDYSRARMQETIAKFATQSAQADAALIYTTGHGVEVDGTVYLLPGDYPLAQKNAALQTRALPIRDIGAGLRARSVNLLFYGGCRDNPLGG
jgi:hypothetical protein